MPARQTCRQPCRRTLPKLWLVSDARNDAVLEDALSCLPIGSGFIYRHYHLPADERAARWSALRRIARARGHVAVLADRVAIARRWGADGIYGAPRAVAGARNGLLALAAVHDFGEIGLANRLGADAMLLSPAFPTRSHPEASALGPMRFRLLALRARVPVIALGGMTRDTACRLRWPRWAAIDGLSCTSPSIRNKT